MEHPLKDTPSSTPAPTAPPAVESPSPEPESYYDRQETSILRGLQAGLARLRAAGRIPSMGLVGTVSTGDGMEEPEVFDKASGGKNGEIESGTGPTRFDRTERARQELLAAARFISAAIVALDARVAKPRMAKRLAQGARDQLWDAAIALEELAMLIDAEQKET
jgi:hypothetical protein